MALLILCAALAGCAYPTQFKPGTPQQEVLSKLGPANTVKKLDGGGERWLYTTQPMGREAYQLQFGADGQLQTTTQVLTAGNFGAIPLGQFTQQQLLQDFLPRMAAYQEARDFPAVKGVSYLSVHLRFGTVSIRQLAAAGFWPADGNHPGLELHGTGLDLPILGQWHQAIRACARRSARCGAKADVHR